MAHEPAGYADKQGNSYENRWIAKQLLRLLSEEIISVTPEPIGDENSGVDLSIVEKNHTVNLHQCKSRNASREYWSVADLHRNGILKSLQFHLDRSENNVFTLVTPIPARNFSDICESARNSDGNPDHFYKYQIEALGKLRTEIFESFCGYLNLDISNLVDRAKAFNYLKRTFIYTFNDDNNAYEDLLAHAKYMVVGESDNVISVLIQYALNSLRKSITTNDVYNYLIEKEFSPRILSRDPRILHRINELIDIFKESIRPDLIDGSLIPRQESNSAFELVSEGSNIILFGEAGIGKSGVLYELIQKFKENDIMFIPVRLDRQEPKNSPLEYGTSLGLTESPAKCIEGISESKKAVLILDQLDALRWTNAHSANSLEVCKSMIREVNFMRLSGKPISVILSCRKYDLDNDPEIKKWLENNKTFNKIEVKCLDDIIIGKITGKYGTPLQSLSERQKKILSIPQHLAMWVSLKIKGHSPTFQTSTQLMRQFWSEKRKELELKGIQSDELKSCLYKIVDNMENSGRLIAPYRLIEQFEKVTHELCTHSIIRVVDRKVSFCHQSYLDFLIADRLVTNIFNNDTNIHDWLGPIENQSLFRREQLRQVLNLICDDDKSLFITTVKSLLSSHSIRFHIKQLVLSVMGQIHEPSELLCDYILNRLEDDYWKEHFFYDVAIGNPGFIQFLISNAIIKQWLFSENDLKKTRAVQLLYSVNEIIGDSVAGVLTEYLANGGSPNHIESALPIPIQNDSDGLFVIRLQLAAIGHTPRHIDWKQFCSKHPHRALPLIDATLSNWKSPKPDYKSRYGQESAFEKVRSEEARLIIDALSKTPVDTFKNLFAHVVRLVDFKPDQYDNALDHWLDLDRVDQSRHLALVVVRSVIQSGQLFANSEPDELLNVLRKFYKSQSPVIQSIISGVMVNLPKTAKYADEAMQWLIDDLSHVTIGTGYNDPEWETARLLIESLSPYCSDDMFSRIEHYIINYHSPDEKREAEYWLKTWKEGHFGYFWGAAQYFLLPALCSARRSQKTDNLISVLNRRYSKYNKDYFVRRMGSWYSIDSPIKDPCRLSDNAWRKIIANTDIPAEHARSVPVGPNLSVESTVRQFSTSLREAAARQPRRFAEFALSLPTNTHASYISSILDGIKSTAPGNIPDEEKKSWEPAVINTIIRVLERFLPVVNIDIAREFCWLIRDRAKEQFPDSVIEKLIEYAKHHQDPKPGKMNVWSGNRDDTVGRASRDDLFTNSLNCTRGAAVHAIGSLLWEHPEYIDKLLPALEACVLDPHPSVRISAVNACLPLLNSNRKKALDLFLIACKDDLRVAACHRFVYFFNTCFGEYKEIMSPLILAMYNSSDPEVAEEGAREICARWTFYDVFNDEVTLCVKNSVPHKNGAASVFSHLITDSKYFMKVNPYLLSLLNDEEEEVRQKASAFFRSDNLFALPDVLFFLKECIHTLAFSDHSDGLLYNFKKYMGSLLQFSELIFEICSALVGPLYQQFQEGHGRAYWAVAEISPILLRLYEQAENNPDIRNRCLDSWDKLFEKRIGVVRDLMRDIDR